MVNQASRSYVDRVALGLEGKRFEPSKRMLEEIARRERVRKLRQQPRGD